MLDEVVDSGDEMFDASETSAADGLLGDMTEPTFDLVEPGRIGGCVVHVEARPLREPQPHLGMLMWGD